MLIRAITAFIALPGMVAFIIPVTIGLHSGLPGRFIAIALIPLCLGTLLLLRCVREFYVAGSGTLAPWAPPVRLVTGGPYRFCRNPMYIGVVTILGGWCVIWRLESLWIYFVVVLCVFQVRVMLVEEPWAARKFGTTWDAYRARVPRWIPLGWLPFTRLVSRHNGRAKA
jgi:protein-S-isoprenylcysteine O-methyltransferase Ste14